MKKEYLIIYVFSLSSFFMNAQTLVKKPKKTSVDQVKVELLYSHYIQDGQHSAITGGQGTEELTVYAPKLKVNTLFKNKNSLSVEAGVDVISSVSTDKIDFVVSSASALDARNYANFSYQHVLNNERTSLALSTGYSFESDYLSIPLGASISHESEDKMSTSAFAFQAFFDDLRWGRLHPDYKRPDRLIYPAELRHIDWFDVHKRNSYNFKFSFSRIINKRNIVGIYPEFSYQAGLLSTPFHRVYFNENSLKVEKLPESRLKAALALKWNSFVGDRWILRNEVNAYTDDFGIRAFSIGHTSVIKLNKPISIGAFFRWYTQEASDFFAPYKAHEISDKYYTSDYDYANFNTFKTGVNLRFSPRKRLGKQWLFDEFRIRYAYFSRTDGLDAHIISTSFSGIRFAKQR